MPVDAYKNILEMPKYQELNNMLRATRLFVPFLTKEKRRELKQTRKDFKKLVQTAESFYDKLGERHWVLHEDMMINQLEDSILSKPAEQVEKDLVLHYQSDGNLDIYINHLKRHPDLLARWDQIEHAKEDYLAGRYDACAMLLIAILDGFVNDIDKSERHGLHTRKPEEMVGFDSLGGHHLGLANVMPVFTKSFHKRVDDEVFELYRNGIVHGCIVSFNNEIVASKAWNYLFAVSDWATCRTIPAPKEIPSLRETLEHHARTKAMMERMEEWNSYSEEKPEEPFDTSPLLEQTEFFNIWQKQQVGLMLPFLFKYEEHKNKSSYIDLVKLSYLPIHIDSWIITRCDHQAPAVAIVSTIIKTNGESYEIPFRWIHVDDNDAPLPEWESGHWVIAPCVPQELNEIKKTIVCNS